MNSSGGNLVATWWQLSGPCCHRIAPHSRAENAYRVAGVATYIKTLRERVGKRGVYRGNNAFNLPHLPLLVGITHRYGKKSVAGSHTNLPPARGGRVGRRRRRERVDPTLRTPVNRVNRVNRKIGGGE